MDAYDEIFDEERNEIMRDLRNRQAEVRAMRKANPRYWEESRAELEAEGWKFIDSPANQLRFKHLRSKK